MKKVYRKNIILAVCIALLVFGLSTIAVMDSLAAAGDSDRAGTGDEVTIRLQYASFDPLLDEPALIFEPNVEVFGGTDGLYILQFEGPVLDEWKTAVEATGVRLYGYIPDFAFIARIPKEVINQVDAIPFVRWVGVYEPAYKIDESLPTNAAVNSQDEAPATELLLSILTLPDADLHAFAEKVADFGGEVLDVSANEFGGYVRVILPQAQIQAVASQADVVWIEPYFQPELLNDKAGGTILKAETVRQKLGLYGQDQIVAVADTGLDVGTKGSMMSDDFEGRIVDGQAICSLFGGRDTWNDIDGHGTHVSGSVLGNGVLSGSQPGSNQFGSSYAGVAPKAKIVFQSVDDVGSGLECVPSNLKDYLIKPAFDQGARVHSNSWGGRSGGDSNPWGGYNSFAQSADQAAWTYKNLLIVFAAGNAGVDGNSNGVVDPDSIYTPATAKNVLTVGASENNRPEKTLIWGNFTGFPVSPLNPDRVANNINGMAGFSSRGPTDDGRIKPDITAPGTYIISARSHDPSAGTGWGVVNNDYIFNGGTSMAAPLTSGGAALVREWLTRIRSIIDPSAALIKAILLNGAADMNPGQYGTGSAREIPAQRPNPVSGWGRVDLENSLRPPGMQQVWVRDEKSGLSSGGSKTFTINLGSSLGSPTSTNPSIQTDTKTPPDQLRDEGQAMSFEGGLLSPDDFVLGTLSTSDSNQLLINPGFESGADNWFTNDSGYAKISQTQARSGSNSAVLYGGSGGWITLYQKVNVPADAASATVIFHGYGSSLGSGDGIYTVLRNTDGQLINYQLAGAANNAWKQFTWTIDADTLEMIRGQEVRVSFEASIESASAKIYIDDTALNLTTPEPIPGGPLRVTLAWTDYPGSPSAAKALVNDLDLEVIAPDGTHYYGNAGVYTSGTCFRDGTWDACNNVEGVFLPEAMNGTYSVIIRGANVPNGPQPYALVVTGDCAYIGCSTHLFFLPILQGEK